MRYEFLPTQTACQTRYKAAIRLSQNRLARFLQVEADLKFYLLQGYHHIQELLQQDLSLS